MQVERMTVAARVAVHALVVEPAVIEAEIDRRRPGKHAVGHVVHIALNPLLTRRVGQEPAIPARQRRFVGDGATGFGAGPAQLQIGQPRVRPTQRDVAFKVGPFPRHVAPVHNRRAHCPGFGGRKRAEIITPWQQPHGIAGLQRRVPAGHRVRERPRGADRPRVAARASGGGVEDGHYTEKGRPVANTV
ncbi:MAG: hypothetical protein ACK5QX_06560 [bacterium]